MCHSTGSIGDTPIGPFFFFVIMKNDYFKTLPQLLIPKRLLTLLLGWFAECTWPPLKNFLIRWFIDYYQVNMAEARRQDASAYTTFNDFFIRQLKTDVRIMGQATLISPADGCIAQIGRVHHGQLLQAKGRHYALKTLLHSSAAAERFENGLYATLYLAPKDYHRIHMPLDGQVKQVVYLPGRLFSVQPATTRVIPQLFSQNERVVVLFDTPCGEMAMILVGAVIVGKIATTWHGEFKRTTTWFQKTYPAGQINLKKGEEMGYFKLGSTVILIMAPNRSLTWRENLQEGTVVRLHQDLT